LPSFFLPCHLTFAVLTCFLGILMVTHIFLWALWPYLTLGNKGRS
jgi:hypothetical protein